MVQSERGTVMTESAAVHPNDEWLVAYLTTGLSPQEHLRVNAHLLGCDQCVHTVAMMQHRLAAAPEFPRPVPAALQAQAVGFVPAADVRSAVAAPTPSPALRPVPGWLAWLRDQLVMLPRFSIVVPGAMAAAALLLLVTRTNWMHPAPQGQISRSIPMHQRLPVTAPEAAVRSEPAVNSPALTTLRRGTHVLILSREGEWYQIELSDGRAGWMEGRAFE